MEEKAVLNNLRRSFSVVNNSSNSTIATACSLRNSNSYLYGGGMMNSHRHNWHQSRLYANAPMVGSYDQFYEAPRLYSSLPQPPLLPLPFSSNTSSVALPLPVKKKIKPSSKNNIKKKKKTTKKSTTKELAADRYKEEEEEEEEEFFLSPPPSSLPLPRLLLSARPKATSCFAEADTGATNHLRHLLRL